nr:MAG TPA: hypothetical protein [Caudoviricetes sp.]
MILAILLYFFKIYDIMRLQKCEVLWILPMILPPIN